MLTVTKYGSEDGARVSKRVALDRNPMCLIQCCANKEVEVATASWDVTYLLTYVRSWALPEKLPIVQPFRKFPAILTDPKVHHRVHKCPSLVPILSQFDPVPTIPSHLSKIHFNIFHPPTSWSSQWALSFWLSHQYPICIPSSPPFVPPGMLYYVIM
jgi:hypothetical protein